MKIVALTVFSLFISGCVAPSYNDVLSSLTEQNYQKAWPRYLSFWVANSELQPNLSVDQAGIECVEFYKGAGTKALETVMAAQLVQCMQSKGWLLKVEEVDLTN